MDNRIISQQEPNGFFVGNRIEDYEKPIGLCLGSDVGSSWDATNNLIHSHSHKQPKSPSHGVGFSENLTTPTVGREPGSKSAIAETLSLGLGELVAYIPGLEGRYCVTTLGRVFSLNYRRTGRAHELAQSTHPEGYKRVKLVAVHANHGTAVHRLVAVTFIPNPLNLPQVNHKDGNKGNNTLENLEWVDNAGNQKHAFETGLHVYANGEDHAMAILSEQDVRDIRDELRRVPAYKGQQTDLARRYGVSNYCIFDIKHGRSWSHVK